MRLYARIPFGHYSIQCCASRSKENNSPSVTLVSKCCLEIKINGARLRKENSLDPSTVSLNKFFTNPASIMDNY